MQNIPPWWEAARAALSDEGHGFAQKENEATAYRAIVAFLDAHL